MKLTKFYFFRGTPLNNVQNTIHFTSNEERDNWFLTQFPSTIITEKTYNFRRDRYTIDIPYLFEDVFNINYMRFDYGFDNRVYYAYITNLEYINDKVTRVSFMLDLVMTYTQGKVLSNLTNVDVIRQHYPSIPYQSNLKRIRSNDDDLQFYTIRQSYQNKIRFSNYNVVFQCSTDLTKDFGTNEEPKLPTSKGLTFDRMTSPVDLYTCTYIDFINMMEKLSDVPWITQNITSVTLIPTNFISENTLSAVSFKSKSISGIKRFNNNSMSKDLPVNPLNVSLQGLRSFLNITDDKHDHLIKSSVIKLELTDYKNTLAIDVSMFKDNIEFESDVTVGYHNELNIIPKFYGSNNTNEKSGEYRNYALSMTNFDSMPILINSGELSKANSAYTRKLAEERTITGRLGQIQNGNMQDKLFNALSVFGDGISISKASSLFTSEYEFKRDQKAQMKTYELQKPSVTTVSYNNAVLMKAGDLGVTLNISLPASEEIRKHRNYYNLFGFEDNGTRLYDVESMTICNWVQFRGNWSLHHVDIMTMTALQTIFENGVRFWHYKEDGNKQNPMLNDIYENVYK